MALFNSVRFQTSIYASFVALLVIWIIHIVSTMIGMELGWLGVLPRELSGLKGVLFAPLIHDDFTHLFYNSMPLIVLITMISFFYRQVAIKATSLMYLLTGLAVWLFARENVFHIGASGVVYALVSFVFFSGLFRRNIKSIILALIVTLLYSGMAAGVLPNQDGISWESHLFGALVGLYVAYLYKNEIEPDSEYGLDNPWVRKNRFPEEEGQYFLERDTFEKTKAEKRLELEKLREAREQRAQNNEGGGFQWTRDDTRKG